MGTLCIIEFQRTTLTVRWKHSLFFSYLGISKKNNLLVRTCGCLVIQQRLGSGCTLSRTTRVVGQGGWIVDSYRWHCLSALLLDLGYESADDACTRCLCRGSGSDDVHSCTRRRWCRKSTNRDCWSDQYESCRHRRQHRRFGVLSSVPFVHYIRTAPSVRRWFVGGNAFGFYTREGMWTTPEHGHRLWTDFAQTPSWLHPDVITCAIDLFISSCEIHMFFFDVSHDDSPTFGFLVVVQLQPKLLGRSIVWVIPRLQKLALRIRLWEYLAQSYRKQIPHSLGFC